MAGPKAIFSKVRLRFARRWAGRSGRLGSIERDLGHRLHVGHIQLLEFADVGQDFVQLAAIQLDFFRSQLKVSELGHAQNVFATYRHRPLKIPTWLRLTNLMERSS